MSKENIVVKTENEGVEVDATSSIMGEAVVEIPVDVDAELEAKLAAEVAKLTEDDGVFVLNGKTFNIGNSFPLTLGDWRKLGQVGLIDNTNNLVMGGPETIAKLLHHLVHKQDRDIKIDDLDVIELDSVVKLFMFARKCLEGGEADLNPPK